MQIELTPETVLTQLGYPINEHTLLQVNQAIAKTEGFDKFGKHLFSLADQLTHLYGVIALSNSRPSFKVKCHEEESSENIAAFRETIEEWAAKYKVDLQKVNGKPTYYILGHH
jgi:hypothetical protein